MKLKCGLGFHTWNGCQCARCGTTRNNGHHWVQETYKCVRCGKEAQKTTTQDEYRFFAAIEYGQLEKVEALLQEHPLLIFSRDFKTDTPLHVAAHIRPKPYGVGYTKQVAVAEFLLCNGADVNAKSIDGQTPLHGAGSGQFAEWLLANGADVNARDVGERTPLHASAEGGYYGGIRELIAAGADVNARDKRGFSPAVLAQKKGHEQWLYEYRRCSPRVATPIDTNRDA